MSKLLVVIVHRDDVDAVSDTLRTHGHRFTRIPTFGGFLDEPNDTLFLAVDDDAVDTVVSVVEVACRPREVEIPLVLLDRLKDWEARTVAHGGATILISDLERIIRL